ncbi:MAG: alpha/beta hydrolase [Candidatus Eremiobacteraeota bacterium]|nr:alpha/beta hydrolase [Candidatus Eremiobacteraeota bacterium]MBC5820571.1 alpha/beta hydrolase [Candidatus Eremiobacteraeota bacterium]
MPLLFLHGWLGAGAIWTLVLDELAQRRRTIAVDLRGFAGSRAAPGPYTVETLANDLSALLAALDLDPLVVIGHSMGAAIAQRFAIDRPDAVEGLVLIAPVAARGPEFSPRLEAMFRATVGNVENTNAWLAKLTHREPPAHVTALLRAAAATASPRAALESFDSWSRLAFEDEARTIATPTLVIAPAEDRPMTPTWVRSRVADVIAGSRLDIVADAGHYVPLEAPKTIAERIEAFLASL